MGVKIYTLDVNGSDVPPLGGGYLCEQKDGGCAYRGGGRFRSRLSVLG
jgi:hypothetical protein